MIQCANPTCRRGMREQDVDALGRCPDCAAAAGAPPPPRPVTVPVAMTPLLIDSVVNDAGGEDAGEDEQEPSDATE